VAHRLGRIPDRDDAAVRPHVTLAHQVKWDVVLADTRGILHTLKFVVGLCCGVGKVPVETASTGDTSQKIDDPHVDSFRYDGSIEATQNESFGHDRPRSLQVPRWNEPAAATLRWSVGQMHSAMCLTATTQRPWGGGMRWDVVVFRTVDTYTRPELFGEEAPVIDRIDLGYDLFLQRLDGAVAMAISTHCSAGGVASGVAQRYAFVRAFPDEFEQARFDDDERLQIAIGLSRLVHPTSIGLEESAQVWGSIDDPTGITVTPGPITGPASEAYIVDTTRPDWLTPADALQLRARLAVYFDGGRAVPDRVRRGLWHHEFAARALDMAARWTSVVTGLEALFNTDKDFITRQFKGRCAAVADELGISLTRRQADTAYQQRSRLSHGAATGVDAGTRQLYILIERLLREILRRGLQDPAWRARFSDDSAVRAAWPIEIPNTCPNCQQPLSPRE
jgi:hypothetical protein